MIHNFSKLKINNFLSKLTYQKSTAFKIKFKIMNVFYFSTVKNFNGRRQFPFFSLTLSATRWKGTSQYLLFMVQLIQLGISLSTCKAENNPHHLHCHTTPPVARAVLLSLEFHPYYSACFSINSNLGNFPFD